MSEQMAQSFLNIENDFTMENIIYSKRWLKLLLYNYLKMITATLYFLQLHFSKLRIFYIENLETFEN